MISLSGLLLETKRTVDAGAIVVCMSDESVRAGYRFRSGRNPAPGTFSRRSASATSQAVYFLRSWNCSFDSPGLAMVRRAELWNRRGGIGSR